MKTELEQMTHLTETDATDYLELITLEYYDRELMEYCHIIRQEAK